MHYRKYTNTMSKESNIAKSQYDDYNRQIIKLYIERNRIIIQENLDLSKLVAEYKIDSNAKFVSVNKKFAEILEYSSAEELMKAINEGEYVFLKADLISLFEHNDYILERTIYLKTKKGAILELQETILKVKEKSKTFYYGLLKFPISYNKARKGTVALWNTVKNIYDKMRSGVVVCDATHNIIYANTMMRQILGYNDLDELPSLQFFNYLPENEVSKAKNALEKLYKTDEQTPPTIYSIIKNDVKITKVEAYSSVITRDKEKLTVTVIDEVKDAVKIDNAILSSNEMYGMTVDNISELCFLLNSQGDICDINSQVEKMWGWNKESCVRKSIFDLGEFDGQKFNRSLECVFEENKILECDFHATNTIYGDMILSTKLFSYSNEENKYVIAIMSNSMEIRQLYEKLNSQYKKTLTLFENSFCGIIYMQGKEIVKVNEMAYLLLKTKKDLRGRTLPDVFPESRRRKRRIVTTILNRKEEFFEYEFMSAGKRVLLEVHLLDIDKTSILCNFVDITLRKKDVVSISGSNEKYESIVRQAPYGVLIGDSNGDIIDVSDRFCEMIKLTPAEILGKNIMAFFSPTCLYQKPFDYTRVDAGEIVSAEREMECSDGTIKIVEMHSYAVSDNMYQAVIMDITQRKIYERQISDYKTRYEKMLIERGYFLKMSKDLTIIYNSDFEIKEVYIGESSKFYRFYKHGNSEANLINDFIRIVSGNEYETIIEQCIARILAGKTHEYIVREIRIGDERYIVEAHFMSMGTDVVLNISDITEREDMVRELRAAIEKSENNEKLQTTFLTNLSHELRTPMNGIIGFADLLLEMENDPEKQEYLRIILSSSDQLLKVLTDIIEMSKLEAGVVMVKNEIVGIKKVLSDILSIISPEQLQDNNVELINLSQNKDEIQIVTDNIKLRQIITNLVGNAVKFTQNGKVEIDYYENKNNVCVTVKDTGVGIPANEINNIFDRFYQSENAIKQATKGSGLGLAIVKSYVEMLHGSIRVESEIGKGTCFFVELPKSF